MTLLRATFVIAAILATIGISTIAQPALADKVGPHPDEDRVKQGAIGEYVSKEGREAYGGSTGREQGDAIQNYARPGDREGSHESFGVDNLGENFSFYASGECHDDDGVCE
jgi:hypothetical protein